MRLVLAAALAFAVTLTAPAAADAKLWRGKTSQGKRVIVRTGADGVVVRVRVAWRSPCSNGTKLKGRTGFTPPFDQASTRAFLDEGSYAVPIKGGGRSIDTVHVRGTLARNGPWRGVFRVRTEFRRRGEVIGTCRLRGVRFTARAV